MVLRQQWRSCVVQLTKIVHRNRIASLRGLSQVCEHDIPVDLCAAVVQAHLRSLIHRKRVILLKINCISLDFSDRHALAVTKQHTHARIEVYKLQATVVAQH